MNQHAVIEARKLQKRYGSRLVVNDISFSVFEGEIFGLIGPNGAGKTTTMECIEGLRNPDAGEARVLGVDPHKNLKSLQDRMGVQLQESQLQKRIKVWEIMDLMASLYSNPVDSRDLLDQLGLSEKVNDRFMNLSGGQKQRLFIAIALINDPDVVFLDELTTGLDPQARHAIWDLVRGVRDRGKTVFLTTHLMEEAEKLCDRVAIVDHGHIVAIDTPAELIRRHCPDITISFSSVGEVNVNDLKSVSNADAIEVMNDKFTVRGKGDDFVSHIIHYVARKEIRLIDFKTERPNLEAVFLKLTGHSVRD